MNSEFFRENNTEAQFFCQLTVAKRFEKTMCEAERRLVEYIIGNYAHRVSTVPDGFDRAVQDIAWEVAATNSMLPHGAPKLIVTYRDFTEFNNGQIRIERTGARHQCLELPVIDYRGSVNFQLD